MVPMIMSSANGRHSLQDGMSGIGGVEISGAFYFGSLQLLRVGTCFLLIRTCCREREKGAAERAGA